MRSSPARVCSGNFVRLYTAAGYGAVQDIGTCLTPPTSVKKKPMVTDVYNLVARMIAWQSVYAPHSTECKRAVLEIHATWSLTRLIGKTSPGDLHPINSAPINSGIYRTAFKLLITAKLIPYLFQVFCPKKRACTSKRGIAHMVLARLLSDQPPSATRKVTERLSNNFPYEHDKYVQVSAFNKPPRRN